MSSADPARYKDVLGRFATGVVVVTAQTADGPAGLTCQSFGALSMDPPLVFFNATSTGSSWQKIRHASAVGISVLSDEQSEVAMRFATSGIDKFAGADVVVAENGAPLLNGALAHITGDIISVATHGDHDMVVVAVTGLDAFEGEPSLYYRGAFRLLK